MAARRFGYVVSIAVNIVLVVVVLNLLEWEIFGFLTGEFSDVSGWIAFSLGATILVNAWYLLFDPPWFRSTSQIVVNLIGIVVTARLLQVFPFDFSDYARDWTWLARTVVIIAIVGLVVGTVAEIVKLAPPPRLRAR